MSEILELIKEERKRQERSLMMIPSENHTSKNVQKAVGSNLLNKYSEGYTGKRYYQGNRVIDQIEELAVKRAKKLFGVEHVNVQPYSGSPANAAVYMALLSPGDTIMGLELSAGGHLTHGHPEITFSGKFFDSVQYGVNEKGVIDYEELAELAAKHKPKMIVAGTTAYSRVLKWNKFARIARSTGAILMADISHIAGLVAAGAHPSPVSYAHIVTTTTHKTLRGSRGAMIMVTKKGMRHDRDMGKKIDRAVFPGLQGGPHNNQTAGIAVALGEAKSKAFREYGKKTVENARILAKELQTRGFNVVSGGTDNHLMVVDLRSKGVSGKDAAVALESVGVVVNYNTVPDDPNPPADPSGIRLGTPGVTTRGLGEKEMEQIAEWIDQVVKNISSETELEKIGKEVRKLCKQFPVPKEFE